MGVSALLLFHLLKRFSSGLIRYGFIPLERPVAPSKCSEALGFRGAFEGFLGFGLSFYGPFFQLQHSHTPRTGTVM